VPSRPSPVRHAISLAAYAAILASRCVVCTVVAIAQMNPKSSRPTAVTASLRVCPAR
jgi:hypothetical protein